LTTTFHPSRKTVRTKRVEPRPSENPSVAADGADDPEGKN
jgi:hypothetical protein